jgi:hypothetical protein
MEIEPKLYSQSIENKEEEERQKNTEIVGH